MMKRLLYKNLLLLVLLFCSSQLYATDYYVKASGGNDTNTGASFSTAFATLQKALSLATSGDKIYMSKGMYIPTQIYDFNTGAPLTLGDPKSVSFKIPDGVEIYGGFAGTETGPITQAVLDTRYFDTDYPLLGTILSGDRLGFNSPSDVPFFNNYSSNSYHVVFTRDVSSATKVDGVTIIGGSAMSGFTKGGGWLNVGSSSNSTPTLKNILFIRNVAGDGGAMCNYASSGTNTDASLTNCLFIDNFAFMTGGAIYNYGGSGTSSPSLINCLFSYNVVSQGGGAVYNFGASSPSFINCSFFKNNGNGNHGGAVYNYGTTSASSPSFINCSFNQNTAPGYGGAMYNFQNSNSSMINCIFSNNTSFAGNSWYNDGAGATPTVSYSLVQEADQTTITTNGYTGTVVGAGMLYATDPLFVNAATGNLKLQPTSPALNVGNSASVPFGITTDLGGDTRIQGSSVDMGAYERFVPSPEINVQGNAVSIVDGDVTPSVTDDTDFGITSTITRTFTIQNIGGLVLNLTGTPRVAISGSSDFTISTQPSANTIAASSNLTFTVTYTAIAAGIQTATISIANNDSDENPYTFVISGSKATKALDFDGTNDWVNTSIALPSTYTKEAWIFIPSANGKPNNIISGGSDGEHAFWTNSVNSYRLSAGHNGNWTSVMEGSPIPFGSWQHVAVTYNATTQVMELYRNGVLVSSATGIPPANGTKIRLGAYDAGNNLLGGKLDEVRIWNVVRSAAQILANKNTELLGNEAGLVAYYTFDEGIADGNNTAIAAPELIDHVCANNGTLQNFAKTGTSSNWVTGNTAIAEVTQSLLKPEINIQGNGNAIADGDITPATLDDTDFGTTCTVTTRTFTIQNIGGLVLNLTGIPRVAISGSSDFAISTQPTANTIATSNSLTFIVTYTPTTTGNQTATISIANNDCDEDMGHIKKLGILTNFG